MLALSMFRIGDTLYPHYCCIDAVDDVISEFYSRYADKQVAHNVTYHDVVYLVSTNACINKQAYVVYRDQGTEFRVFPEHFKSLSGYLSSTHHAPSGYGRFRDLNKIFTLETESIDKLCLWLRLSALTQRGVSSEKALQRACMFGDALELTQSDVWGQISHEHIL